MPYGQESKYPEGGEEGTSTGTAFSPLPSEEVNTISTTGEDRLLKARSFEFL